jgi:hypothetical protein
MPLAPDPQRHPLGSAHRRTSPRGDDVAVGHRPGRRHGAELVLDDDPGRAPDQGDDDEGDEDARARNAPVMLGHSARIAAASASACAGSCPSSSPAAPRPGPSRRSRSPARAAPRFLGRDLQEHLVGLDRQHQPLARRLREARRASLAARALRSHTSSSSIASTCAARIAALGQQVPGALAAIERRLAVLLRRRRSAPRPTCRHS